MTAAEQYAARVDAVLAQRARLRGAEASGDPFGGLEPDHPLLKADPRRPLDANLNTLADLIEPSDAIVDVGGGAGRMSLPLGAALPLRHQCRSLGEHGRSLPRQCEGGRHFQCRPRSE
jgi:hypothetical protein